MLNIILGRSGSGKTEFIRNKIIQDCQNGIRTYYIVPEQQAYTTELNILPKIPGEQRMNLTVTGFRHLANQVFGVYGGLSYNYIDDGTRELLMWNTLRNLSDSMTEYRDQKANPAFTRLMLSTIDNLRSSGITPDLLDSVCQKLDNTGNDTLRKKLSDISAIYEKFNIDLTSAFGQNPADILDKLAATLSTHPEFFNNSNVYIDSFTSFTMQEYRVLKEIFPNASDVTISLCVDPDNRREIPFTGIDDTYKKIIDIARAAQVKVVQKKLFGSKRTKAPELCAIEKYLWNFNSNPEATEVEKFGNAVEFARATTIYTEVELAALKILELKDGGTPFGKIAVIIRDAETRRGIIDAALEKYGIPYFFSERTDLSSKPIARLILTAIRACSHGWQQVDIISLIKTGLCDVSEEEVDMFCDYCTKWNINGKKFESPVWSMNPDGYTETKSPRAEIILRTANKVKDIVMQPLIVLSNRLKSGSVKDMCRAVYDYLTALDIKQQLIERAEYELGNKNIREAGELVRLYDYVIEALVKLCNTLPDAKLNRDEFSTLLSMLFSATDIGSVPDMHDCVIIGSAATLRVENISAAIILGLNEGEFPGTPSEDGIITSADMQLISQFEPAIEQHNDTSSIDELFYVYRAFAAPDRKLILMMSDSRLGGNGNQPSFAFSRALEICVGKQETNEKSKKAREDRIERFSGLPHNYSASEKTDTDYSISTELISKVIGNTLYLTKSSLGKFTGCPYSYYCDYILKLRQISYADISYSDSGNFIHRIAERFLKQTVHDDGSVDILDDARIAGLVDEIIEEYINDMLGPDRDVLTPQIRYRFLRLRNMSINMLKSIIKEFSDGQFRSVRYEQKMSYEADCPDPIEIKFGDGNLKRTIITGTIDRIDQWTNGNDIYIRIIDYKTSDKKFSDDEKGFIDSIQLLVYLFAVCGSHGLFGNLNPIAASAEYICVSESDQPVTRNGFILDMPEVINAASNSLDASIVGNSNNTRVIKRISCEQRDEYKTEMTETIKSISQQIFSGNAKRTPSKDACQFCTVKDTCPVRCKE